MSEMVGIRRLLRDDKVWIPVALMVLAAAARVFHLGTESLWNDELATVMFTSDGPIEAVRAAMGDTSPPLYYVLQSLINAIFGTNEWTLRVLSAFAGVACTGLTYDLGRRLFGREVGIVAAAGFALGSMPLRYGQEARAYSLGVLLVLLTVWTLLRALETGRTAWYVGFALAAAGAAFTHLFAAFAVAGVIGGTLVHKGLRRRAGRRFLVACAAALALWAPWAFVLTQQASVVIASETIGAWGIQAPRDVSRALNATLIPFLPWGWTNPLLTAAFLGLLLFGAVPSAAGTGPERGPGSQLAADDASGQYNDETTMALTAAAEGGAIERPPRGDTAATAWAPAGAAQLALVLGWLVGVYGIGLGVSRFVVPIFNGRMAMFAAPALLLLAANGALRLWRPLAALLALAVLAYAGVGLMNYYTEPQKAQWREVTEYLIEQDAEDVVAYTSFVLADVSTYAKLLGHDEGITGIGVSRDLSAEELTAKLAEALASRDEVWVVQGHVEPVVDEQTLIEAVLADMGWHAVEVREYVQAKVSRYVAPAGWGGGQ